MTPSSILSVFGEAAFRGRVYGVTGGAHGIGEATVKSLCALGASVVLIDTHEEHLGRVQADLDASGASRTVLWSAARSLKRRRGRSTRR